MLREIWLYLKTVFTNWLTGYWFVTAIPEVVRLFWPDLFARWAMLASKYIPAQGQHRLVLGLGAFGLAAASFMAWRGEHRQLGLRARIKQTHWSGRRIGTRQSTRIFVLIDLLNSGRPTIAMDWELFIRRRFVARAFERRFERIGGEKIDPQKTPLREGERLSGSLSFQTRMTTRALEKSRKQWRIHFRDTAGRALTAEETEKLGSDRRLSTWARSARIVWQRLRVRQTRSGQPGRDA